MGLSHSPRIVTNGLVLCLDAGNPKSYPGSGTTWTDLSGLGNSGSMSNVTYNSGNGGYMSFNGTTSIVDCGTSDTLYSTSLTIEAIVYPISYGGGLLGRIVDRSAAVTIGYLFYMDNAASDGSPVGVKYGVNAAGANQADYWANATSLSSWQIFTVTQSGSSVSLYKNGSLYGASAVSFQSPTSGTTNFYVGNRADLARGFDGRISSVKIYNRALSAAEIRQNFNATRGRYGI